MFYSLGLFYPCCTMESLGNNLFCWKQSMQYRWPICRGQFCKCRFWCNGHLRKKRGSPALLAENKYCNKFFLLLFVTCLVCVWVCFSWIEQPAWTNVHLVCYFSPFYYFLFVLQFVLFCPVLGKFSPLRRKLQRDNWSWCHIILVCCNSIWDGLKL